MKAETHDATASEPQTQKKEREGCRMGRFIALGGFYRYRIVSLMCCGLEVEEMLSGKFEKVMSHAR